MAIARLTLCSRLGQGLLVKLLHMELLEIIAILLSDWLACPFTLCGSVGPVTITQRSGARIHDGAFGLLDLLEYWELPNNETQFEMGCNVLQRILAKWCQTLDGFVCHVVAHAVWTL
jgi:hypothetical protein